MNKHSIAQLANRFYVGLQIQEKLPLEKYEIYIKEDFDSASWRFYNGKHQVVIGSQIFMNLTKEISTKDKALYLRAYLHHELAHSIWTDKNLNAIDDMLKKHHIAFSMFNLFEDARIEEKMRHHLKKRFDWLKYESLDIAKNPIQIFYYLIQSEHNKKAYQFIENNLDLNIEHHFNTVLLFYKKVIKCESHTELIKLLKKWYEYFPNTQKYEEENLLKSYLFSRESIYASDDEKFNELIDGLKNSLIIDNKRRERKEHKEKQSQKECLLSTETHKLHFDKRVRNTLLSKMKKLFLSPKRVSSTIIPSKKLNIKNIVSKNSKIFKRKDREKFLKKKISIILDMSRSMHKTMNNMQLVVDVLDTMAAKNVIDATLILSGVQRGKYLNETLSMPLQKNILERIIPRFDAEGLHSTMSTNLSLLQKSDYVWVLTDGMICEGSLDKSFYAKHNIKLHAFYIGDTSYKKEMEESFDSIICEESVINLANKIFMLIK